MADYSVDAEPDCEKANMILRTVTLVPALNWSKYFPTTSAITAGAEVLEPVPTRPS